MVGGVTCPNCGKDNPDFLDNCQFCQAVLRRESTLNIGENPTKKATGELEGILPDWLREARQQGRDSAEEEAKKEATKPRIEKVEPPDLLAGLAFQAADDEDEVPDWLAAINPVADKKAPAPAQPVEEEPSDFFAQFNKPAQEAAPAANDVAQSGTPKDELTGWMSQASEQPSEDLPFDFSGLRGDDLNAPVAQEPVKPAEPEDLGWLHELESSSKKTEAPRVDMDWMANSDSSSSPSAGDDLSWLNTLGGTPAPSFDMPAQPTSSQEDLSWLNNLGGTPAPAVNEPVSSQPQEDLSWLNNLGGTPIPSTNEPAQPASSPEDLSWLNNLGDTSAPSFNKPAQPASSQEDFSWLSNLGGTPAPSFNEPVPLQPPADLGWLHDLGGTPIPPTDEPAQPASSQEDLSWLSNLGGTSTPSFNEPTPSQPQEDLGWLNNLGGTPNEPAQPASSQEDLGWLSNLGGTPAPSFEESTFAQPTSSQDDLGWLSNLDNAPTLPSSEPASVQPAPAQEDLDWLNNLGATPASSFNEPAPAQPASSQDDLGWLSNLGETPIAPSFNELESPAQPEESNWLKDIDNQQHILSPRQTAPLSEEAAHSMPDWLKAATEVPAMPPLGATSMDWFTSQEKSVADQSSGQTQGEAASVAKNIFPAPTESAPLSNQDIDSLFAVDMPDWLSKPGESATDTISTSANIPSGVDDSLAPVNLPSWVQAMRPVEAAIGEVSAVSADQNTEKEGPLAGLRGVIPFAPVGSAQRPKSISLKLQATEEQQTTAALLEQILASETTALPLKSAPFVVSQRILRWLLTGLFLIVLSVMIGMGSQFMPTLVTNPKMADDITQMSGTIQRIPESAPVLVVIDYEPALASEMEAAAGPLLDQLVVARRPNITFISNSPNGSALAERLMTGTKINQSAPAGLGYQLDAQYFNLGYLPGGSAGVQGFVAGPKVMMPAAKVNLFSDFAAVIVITDHAESGLVWVEQLELAKQNDPALVSQPLLVVASAQAGPLLRPYVSSKQVNGMISGLYEAAYYESMNGGRPGIARSYWDAFGVGLFMAILAIVVGSIWSLITGIRARRAEAEQG